MPDLAAGHAGGRLRRQGLRGQRSSPGVRRPVALEEHLPGLQAAVAVCERDEHRVAALREDLPFAVHGVAVAQAAGVFRQDGGEVLRRAEGPRQLLPQLTDKGGRHVRIVKQIQFVFCPRHGNVEQPPVLLIGALGVLRAVRAVRVGGQDAVVDIEQEDAVILEPLAAVDGRERQARVGRVAVGADELPERIEPREKRGGRGMRRGEHAEDRKFARVEPPLGDEPAVAHRAPDRADERLARRLRQRVQPRAELLRGFAAGIRKIALREQAREHRRVRPRAFGAGGQRRLPGDHGAEFIIDAQKPLRIVRRGGKAQDIAHVADDAVREERILRAAAAVGKTRALQRVDEREGAVIVAVEDGKRRLMNLRGQREQIPDLRLPRSGVDRLHRLPGGADGTDGLGVAAAVFGDEGVRRLQDLGRGAVILLHEQQLRAGVGLRELQQRLGPGGAEAVDALVLVADQKQIAGLLGQQPDDRVLHARGILRFVDAQVRVLRLKLRQHVRMLAQNGQRVGHLVVVVHLPRGAQGLTVAGIDREKAGDVKVLGADLVCAQHHVFAVGDRGADLADGRVGGIFAVQLQADPPDERGKLALVLLQRERRAAQAAAGLDDFGRQAVDRAELRRPAAQLRKQRGKARAQLLRGGDGIGHDQNAAGVDPAAKRQIPQPRDEHRRLPAAGHGQQQNCAVYGLHGGLLLRAEVRHVLGGKFLRRHTSSSSTTGQWSLPSTSARIEAETTRGISRSDTIK